MVVIILRSNCADSACSVLCGMISQYNRPFEEQYAVRGLGSLVSKRIRMEGFVVTDPYMFKWRDARD